MNKYKAMDAFFNSFGIPAYVENCVPKTASMPYLTYEVITDSLSDTATALTCQLWYKSNAWKDINAKAETISLKLAIGAKLATDDGYIMLYRGKPFSNNISDPNDTTIKCKVINITADFITL